MALHVVRAQVRHDLAQEYLGGPHLDSGKLNLTIHAVMQPVNDLTGLDFRPGTRIMRRIEPDTARHALFLLRVQILAQILMRMGCLIGGMEFLAY